MWLTALTSANKMISEVGGTSIGDRTMLDALIPAENKLRDALNSGSNPINAFGEAVKTAETFAMQTVNMSGSRSVDSINCKVLLLYAKFILYTSYVYLDSRQNYNLFIIYVYRH